MLDLTAKPPAKDDPVKNAGVGDFEDIVLRASMQKPVIVDFWAPWCAPCKQLVPVLEKIVRGHAGQVILAKVNIDENPELAQALQVRSVPTVIAFWQGRPVDGFMDAKPESEVKQFIDRLLAAIPAANVPPPGEDLPVLAEKALQQGDAAAAAAFYSRLLAQSPDNPAALSGLAKCHVAVGDWQKAEAVLGKIPEDKQGDAAVVSALASVELARQAAAAGPVSVLARKVEANPDDLAARFDLALALFAAASREAAANQLLEIIRRDRGWEGGKARDQVLKFLAAWGFDDPLAAETRRRLSSLLFS